MHLLATCTRPAGQRGLITLALLCGLLLGAARPARAFAWEIDVTPAGELFAALELSHAGPRRDDPNGDGNGLVSIRLRGEPLPRRVDLEIRTEGLRTPARLQVEPDARTRRGRLDLRPRLDWDPHALRALRAARSQRLEVTLVADGVVQSRSVMVRLHPLEEAPYYVREGRERVDLGWIFAGYVDPSDTVVEEVLALARDAQPGFDGGVARRDAAIDLRRAGAVWAALEAHGLHYDDRDPALGRGPVVWSQRVRVPQATWRDRRANCIDSSVLIASVFERIGLDPLIVLVPGHAFVGYRNADGSAEYLETTMLGARAGALDSFERARAAGRARWRKAAARLDGRHAPEYAIVDVRKARSVGILPFPAAASAPTATAPRSRSGPAPVPGPPAA